MRHRNALTPTMRLIVQAIETGNNLPQGVRELTAATGGSIYTISRCCTHMSKKGYLTRTLVNTTAAYTLGTLPEVQR